jgi:hypothetical protein
MTMIVGTITITRTKMRMKRKILTHGVRITTHGIRSLGCSHGAPLGVALSIGGNMPHKAVVGGMGKVLRAAEGEYAVSGPRCRVTTLRIVVNQASGATAPATLATDE